MITNEGDTSTIAHGGFGNFHSYALDKFLEEVYDIKSREIVFENGKPKKSEYRKYKVSVDKNDDYNTMKEILYRRYQRAF